MFPLYTGNIFTKSLKSHVQEWKWPGWKSYPSSLVSEYRYLANNFYLTSAQGLTGRKPGEHRYLWGKWGKRGQWRPQRKSQDGVTRKAQHERVSGSEQPTVPGTAVKSQMPGHGVGGGERSSVR